MTMRRATVRFLFLRFGSRCGRLPRRSADQAALARPADLDRPLRLPAEQDDRRRLFRRAVTYGAERSADPGGRVAISLSDGRKLNLPQTLSGSGIRYANADESFVFWSKGNTAFAEEGKAMTYAGCVAAKSWRRPASARFSSRLSSRTSGQRIRK